MKTGPERLGWRRISRTAFLTLERDYLIEPSHRWSVREVVRHPGSVVVAPWDGERVVLIRQYRHAAGRPLLELPAGKLDVGGEPPEQTARRECVEEVGLDPGRLVFLHGCYLSPGFTDEYCRIYLATDLSPAPAQPHGFEEESSSVVRLAPGEVRRRLDNAGFENAPTIIGLYALLDRLGR